MKLNEFNIIFKKICKYYNNENYNDKDLTNIYFNEMKRINDRYDYFEELLFKKCKFFPKITDVIDIRYKMNEEITEDKVNINIPVCKCNLCNGTGYRGIYDDKHRYFVVACDCKNGDNKLYDGRTIQDKKHRTEYTVKRFREVFANE